MSDKVVCIRCKKTKDSNKDFYWTRTTRSAYCKECQKQYRKQWLKGHRKIVLENSHRLSEKGE